jgi:hypothetical protein
MQFEIFEPTQIQSRMLEAGRTGRNRCVVYRLEGALDVPRLSAAVQQVVRRCAPFSYK